eukprot:gene10584-11729_t
MMNNIVYAFGLNEDGQCYSKSKKDHENDLWQPVLVHFPSPRIQIISVSAGSRHSLALSSEGHVYSWGWGHIGQLGHGECVNVYQPKRIECLPNPIITISAGGMHSACITQDYQCYTWGCNTFGQLGIGKSFQVHHQSQDGDTIAIPTPSLVHLCLLPDGQTFLHNQSLKEFTQLTKRKFSVKKVSCGGCHTAVITTEGEVYSWGQADNGQTGCAMWYLGFSSGIYAPYKVPDFLQYVEERDEEIVDISCGGFYTLILTTEALYGMGKEDFGCLGVSTDTNIATSEAPRKLVDLHESNHLVEVSAGGWHSLLVLQGQALAWGKGEYGRLGNGSDASSLVPLPIEKVYPEGKYEAVPLEQKVVQGSAGGAHSLFHTGDHVYATGRLDCGRCGTKESSSPDSADRSWYPRDITSSMYTGMGMNVAQVSAGGAHSLVLARYDGNDPETVISAVDNYLFSKVIPKTV